MSNNRLSKSSPLDPHTPQAWRNLLVSVAYKMLGSLAEAEDLASDVILRWLEAPPAQLDDPKAYAVRMVINRSLNRLTELKRERESYRGPWLPEPVLDANLASEEFSIGILRLMETLNPVERAVFILRNAFDYEFDAIGDFVEKNEANCRKILSRANQKLQRDRPTDSENKVDRHQIVEEILLGFEEKDIEKVFEFLHKEVVLWSDGGGKVAAALKPIHGAEKVAQFLKNIAQLAQDVRLEARTINGQPGIFAYVDGQLSSVMVFEFSESKVSELLVMRNPDKITHLFSM